MIKRLFARLFARDLWKDVRPLVDCSTGLCKRSLHIIGLQHGRHIEFAVSACTIKRHGGLDMYLAKRAIWLTGIQHY